jgi:hypothetical protein
VRGVAATLLVAAGAGVTVAWQQWQAASSVSAPVSAPTAQAAPTPAPPASTQSGADEVQAPQQASGILLIEQGDTAAGLARLRQELAAREAAAAATAGAEARLAAAHSRMALAQGLVASGAYAAADAEFKLAREAYAAQPASPATRIALAEVDLARANGQYLRKHFRTAGQTVRALRASLPAGADPVLGARAALLEALIQPGGTAIQAYAAAREALPVMLADFEADPANLPKLRESALAWRRTGDIAARAEQLPAACANYALAEKRYAELETRGQLNALDRAARTQLNAVRAACR